MFLMEWAKLSAPEKNTFFTTRIQYLAKAAGPRMSDVIANKLKRSDAFKLGLDASPPSKGFDGAAFEIDMTNAANKLLEGDVQPWGRMIRTCMDAFTLEFRPAAKVVHRCMCGGLKDARAVTYRVLAFFGSRGYADRFFWADVMCGDSTVPIPPDVQSLICTDVAGPELARYAAELHGEMKKAAQRKEEAEEAAAAVRAEQHAAWAEKQAAFDVERAARKAELQEAIYRRKEAIQYARRQKIAAGIAGAAAAAVIGTLVVRRVRRRKRT